MNSLIKSSKCPHKNVYNDPHLTDEETDAQGGKIFDKVYQENIH